MMEEMGLKPRILRVKDSKSKALLVERSLGEPDWLILGVIASLVADITVCISRDFNTVTLFFYRTAGV